MMKKFCSLLLGVLVVSVFGVVGGCAKKDSAPTKSGPGTPPAKVASEEHGHEHGSGPHGGAIADWGGGAFHIEFTVDHTKKEATVYILGSDEKTPTPIKASKIRLVIDDPATDVELNAVPQTGEAEGSASRFVGVHDNIGIVREFAGTISGEVAGVPYVGDFKEIPAK